MFLLPFKRTFIEVNPIAQHLGGQKYKWGPTYPISKDLDVLMELTAFPRSISLLHHVRSSHLDKHDFIHHLETTRTWCYGEPAPGLRSTPSPRPTQILMCTHRHPSLLTKPPPHTHTAAAGPFSEVGGEHGSSMAGPWENTLWKGALASLGTSLKPFGQGNPGS